MQEEDVTPWFLAHAMVHGYRDEILIAMRDEVGVVTEYRVPLPIAKKIQKELKEAIAKVEEHLSRQKPWESP